MCATSALHKQHHRQKLRRWKWGEQLFHVLWKHPRPLINTTGTITNSNSWRFFVLCSRKIYENWNFSPQHLSRFLIANLHFGQGSPTRPTRPAEMRTPDQVGAMSANLEELIDKND